MDRLVEYGYKQASRVARIAGLRINGPLILRHAFCSHLAMRGAPAKAIQELAGHNDLTATQRYMHLQPSAIHDAIWLLEVPGATAGGGDIVESVSACDAKLAKEAYDRPWP